MSGEFSIHFLAVEGSRYLAQMPAHCMSVLSLAEHSGMGLRIVGVTVNGAPRKFHRLTVDCVTVSPPIPHHADRVTLHCLAPESEREPAKLGHAYSPLPELRYGLQRPEHRRERPSP